MGDQSAIVSHDGKGGVVVQVKISQAYHRLYAGNLDLPARFWSVAWCVPEELEDALKSGWLIDENNLFGPNGKYERKQPTG